MAFLLKGPRSLHQGELRLLQQTAARNLHHATALNQQASPEPAPEPKPERLPYTAIKGLRNVRSQPRAPYASRHTKRVRQLVINDSIDKLRDVYRRLFGAEPQLPGEIMWQAVTHKSFDHGRQPFNQKLALLGGTLLRYHAAIHLLRQPPKPAQFPEPTKHTNLNGQLYQDPAPYVHSDYGNLNGVTGPSMNAVSGPNTLLPVLEESGLLEVIRWTPAFIDDLVRSGQVTVAQECLFAIIGSVALHSGEAAARNFVKDRVLRTTS